MLASLLTSDFSAVLLVCVCVVCNLEELGQYSNDPDLPKRLPTYKGWSSNYWTTSLDMFSLMLSCPLPSDFAVGATDNFLKCC